MVQQAPVAAAWVALPVNQIRVGDRLREVDPATVANLVVAITESEFFGSVIVRPSPDAGEDPEAPKYELVAGAHRLAAMAKLGRQHIPSTIRILTDDEARQIEIDENLVRRGLTPLERAEMLLARFDVWGRRFPTRVDGASEQAKPKRGRPPKNSEMFSQFLGGTPETMGFAAETAASLELDKRTIEMAWSTVRGLPQPLRTHLHGTWIARNAGVLRQLAQIADRDLQAKAAERLIAGETKSVSDAIALASGNTPVKPAQTPVDEALKAFRDVWGKASPSARAAILDDLAAKKLPGGFRILKEEAGG